MNPIPTKETIKPVVKLGRYGWANLKFLGVGVGIIVSLIAVAWIAKVAIF